MAAGTEGGREGAGKRSRGEPGEGVIAVDGASELSRAPGEAAGRGPKRDGQRDECPPSLIAARWRFGRGASSYTH